MAATKKILKCEYENHWRHFTIKEMPLEDLWCSQPQVIKERVTDGPGHETHIPFYDNLKKSILKEGMHFPVMCVKASAKKLIELKLIHGNKLSQLPFWHNERNPQSKYINSVWGGSQRVYLAIKLGYTHIDAAIIPTIEKACRLMEFQSAPYKTTIHWKKK